MEIELFKYLHTPVLDLFYHSRISLVPICGYSTLPFPSLGNPWSVFCFNKFVFFALFLVNRIIQYGVFSIWLPSLSVMVFKVCPCCSMYQDFVSFYCWIVLRWRDILCVLSSLVLALCVEPRPGICCLQTRPSAPLALPASKTVTSTDSTTMLGHCPGRCVKLRSSWLPLPLHSLYQSSWQRGSSPIVMLMVLSDYCSPARTLQSPVFFTEV